MTTVDILYTYGTGSYRLTDAKSDGEGAEKVEAMLKGGGGGGTQQVLG